MTLVEVLIGTALLVGGGGVLLVGMQQAMSHMDYLSQFQVAMNAAQGQLEALVASPFDTLVSDPAYGEGAMRLIPLPDLPGGVLAIQIRSADVRSPTNPSLLDLHVAACWTSRGRLIGENEEAQLCVETDEAAYPNPGWEISSPAMVSTRVARRD